MKRYTLNIGLLLFLLLAVSCTHDVDLEAGSYQYNGNAKSLINIVPNAVTDVDGNVYNAVKIGNQYWMKENLKTTRYADGTAIAQGNEASSTTAYWYYPANNSTNKEKYGLLYNWMAVVHGSSGCEADPSGLQGICPKGWHVPSWAEFKELKTYCGKHYALGGNSENIGKALAAQTEWQYTSKEYAIGNNPKTNNVSGFSALPAGYLLTSSFLGMDACFWSATPASTVRSYFFDLHYNNADVNGLYQDYYNVAGLSVRCVSDGDISGGGDPVNPTPSLPTVTTSSVSNITANSAACGGNVTSDGDATVTARGVCWSTSPNPTISNSKTTNGNGTGSYSSSLTGLAANTTYYVRAYATNSVGTAYGEQKVFKTSSPVITCGNRISDVEGNTYNTIKIGDQCWMKENLRSTKYSDGVSIAQGSGASSTDAYWYYPDNNVSNKASYGLLYNWSAVMRSSSGSTADPSGIQGICPNGWHVPSQAEFEKLKTYCGQHYAVGGNSSYIGKSLAATVDWKSNQDSYTIGNNLSANNASGFSALPAGHYYYGYHYFSYSAYFWSATSYGGTVYSLYLNYSVKYADESYDTRDYAHSVRCLKD